MRHVGRSLRRLEDRRLVAGRAGFPAGPVFRGELAMALARAPVAAGRLAFADVGPAFEVPGVVAVWTAEDVAGACAALAGEGDPFRAHRQPLLGGPAIGFFGEPLAAVFAESPGAAEDAAERIAFAVEPASPDAGEPVEVARVDEGFGDVAAAVGRADQVVELSVSLAPLAVPGLGTRALSARWDGAAERLEVVAAGPADPLTVKALARLLGVPEGAIAFLARPAAGPVAASAFPAPEAALACLAARRLERPVGWREGRREALAAGPVGERQHHRARLAADDDGTIRAIESRFRVEAGAYLATVGAEVAQRAAALMPGPYAVGAFRAQGGLFIGAGPPAARLPGEGAVAATIVRERLVHCLAARLDVCPMELRRDNLVGPRLLPFDRAVSAGGRRIVLEAGDYPLLLEKARRRFSLDLVRRRLADRRADGERVGLGTAFFLEEATGGTVAGARIAFDADGNVRIATGLADTGTGGATAIAQVAADVLGIPLDRMRVETGFPALAGRGSAAEGGVSASVAATAVQLAAEDARGRILSLAGRLLGLPAETLTITEGRVREADRLHGASLPVGALVAALEAAPLLTPSGALGPPGLSVEAWCNADQPAHPYGFLAAVVEVDGATGAVAVPRVYAAVDVGTAIHPRSIEGEVAGAVARGVGAVLLEDAGRDGDGLPRAASLPAYGLPTAREAPEVEVLLTEDAPNPLAPLGLKGARHLGLSAVAAAVANGIDEALGLPGAVTALPVRPDTIRALVRGVPRA